MFLPENGWPCLACLVAGKTAEDTCSTAGVLPPLTHALASFQTAEAVKLLTGNPPSKPQVMALDLWEGTLDRHTLNQKGDCPCCAHQEFPYLSGKRGAPAVKLCGDGLYQMTAPLSEEKFSLLSASEQALSLGQCILLNKVITLFPSGRCLVKAQSEQEARTLHAEIIGH